MEYREDKASTHELTNSISYEPFSLDEGDVVADVYHMMSYFFSSSSLINNEAYF